MKPNGFLLALQGYPDRPPPWSDARLWARYLQTVLPLQRVSWGMSHRALHLTPSSSSRGIRPVDWVCMLFVPKGSCCWGHGVVTVGLGGRAPGSGTCQRGRDQPWSRVVIRCKGGHVAGGRDQVTAKGVVTRCKGDHVAHGDVTRHGGGRDGVHLGGRDTACRRRIGRGSCSCCGLYSLSGAGENTTLLQTFGPGSGVQLLPAE